MTDDCRRIFGELSRPLQPLPTDAKPRLQPLQGVRAVLLDVYGTMLISASGEVGTAAENEPSAAAAEAMQAMGADDVDGESVAAHLHQTIKQHHEEAKCRGEQHPEVDIVAVWSDTLADLVANDVLPAEAEEWSPRRLAIEYEARANPVWPMPGLKQFLAQLRSAGLALGIVSNAQFFTPELFPAVVGEDLAALGFDEELLFFSYVAGCAKPGGRMFELALETLASRDIRAADVVYIGNDMLNDVTAASRAGMKTMLFAGDARSYRMREDDPRVEGVAPDVVVTELSQASECLISPSS